VVSFLVVGFLGYALGERLGYAGAQGDIFLRTQRLQVELLAVARASDSRNAEILRAISDVVGNLLGSLEFNMALGRLKATMIRLQNNVPEAPAG
jgi:hypothetical protein